MKRTFYAFFSLILTVLAIGFAKNTETFADTAVTSQYEDYNVIPDKYNTGCNEAYLTPVVYNEYYGGALIVGGGDGSAVLNFAKVANQKLDGIVYIANVDFSQVKKFRVSGEEKALGNVTIIFDNCKFYHAYTSLVPYSVSTVYNNCTFMQFQGANATFNNCQFRGDCFDGINPCSNVYVNSCYFCDKSHEETAENAGKHTDGTQIYGYNGIETIGNIHFTNCRFEIPQLSCGTAVTKVNSCLMVTATYSNIDGVEFTNCHINGGGYSVYCCDNYGKLSVENVSFNNISCGAHRKYGLVYTNSMDGVDYSDIYDTQSLYVSSVWKDGYGTHISVTNDTAVTRTLLVETNKGSVTYRINACPTYETVGTTSFDNFPFDLDYVVGGDLSWLVCYDITNGMKRQIRFVNFDNKQVFVADDGNIYEYSDFDIFCADAFIDNLDNSEEDNILRIHTVDELGLDVTRLFGSCGALATWEIIDDTLYIDGVGKMDNYHSQKVAPWFEYAESIKTVVIGEGITRTGNQAFRKLINLETVIIPESVKVLGSNSFIGCKSLKHIDLPSTLTEIGNYCFNSTGIISVTFAGDWANVTIGDHNDNLIRAIGR